MPNGVKTPKPENEKISDKRKNPRKNIKIKSNLRIDINPADNQNI